MEFHLGRLFDHVHLRAHDLEASKRFYRAVLEVLGVPVASESPRHFNADELYITAVDPGTPRADRGVHLAFQAKDRETVQRFHEAALKAGGKDNGGPGERNYHPGYYAAFVFDPDGNNIEAVYHGEAQRSAASVKVTF